MLFRVDHTFMTADIGVMYVSSGTDAIKIPCFNRNDKYYVKGKKKGSLKNQPYKSWPVQVWMAI